MATFFAYRIIAGRTTYERVPKFLRPRVKQILEEEGFGELAE